MADVAPFGTLRGEAVAIWNGRFIGRSLVKMVSMNLEEHARPWWSLHTLSWIWLFAILLASVTINVVIRNDIPRQLAFVYGWPLGFAETRQHEKWTGFGPLAPPQPLVFLPTSPDLVVVVAALLVDIGVCITIVLLSTWMIERWACAVRLPRIRITLKMILIVIAWASSICIFFHVPNQELQLVLGRFHLSLRVYEWCLMTMFFAFGVAVFGLVDLCSFAFRRVHNRG